MDAGEAKGQAGEQHGSLRRGADIAERFLVLATEILALVRRLPRDVATRHIVSQLVRSGTSAGANYAEARAAESRADFVHKLRVAAKEMREAAFWLELIGRATPRLPPAPNVAALLREANELTAILMSSSRTARATTR